MSRFKYKDPNTGEFIPVATKEEVDSFKSAYASYVDSNNLKVAKVDKELNDFQKTLSQVNINQEAKQSVTDYGVISLPKNAANGQVSASVKGVTRTNLIPLEYYGDGFWDNNGVLAISDIYKAIIINNLPAGTYTLSFMRTDLLVIIRKNNGTLIAPASASPITFTIATTETIKLTLRNSTTTTWSFGLKPVDERLILESGNTANSYISTGTKSTICAGRITAKNEDETEQSQLYYVAKDPETGEILEARSVPNGTKDEIRVTDGKLIKRVSDEVVLNGSEAWAYLDTTDGYARFYSSLSSHAPYLKQQGVVNFIAKIENYNFENVGQVDYASMLEDGNKISLRHIDSFVVVSINVALLNNVSVSGFKQFLATNPLTLTYQLATPIEIPIETSGILLSYPSGTVWLENAVADAGIYTDKFTILQQDLPIKEIEKISKVDFTTGVETQLDITKAVIAGDKKSFTHPNLTANDIVFTTYFYDKESTLGEMTVEYYDSRHVLKDSVTGKFYKVVPTVANGVLSNTLVEV